jgi:hypothetical protein
MEIILPPPAPPLLIIISPPPLINIKRLIDERIINYFILFLILVFHLEQWLAVLDGELCQHCARPEHIAMPHDVVAVDLGEDPPVL